MFNVFTKRLHKLKGHLSPFCACAAVWFLIRRNTFQSWCMCEKSPSIDLMSRVEIVITILINYIIYYDRFKRHILFLELKTVEKIRCPQKRILKAARDESYSASFGLLGRKDRRTKIGNLCSCRCGCKLRESKTDKALTQLNIINILCKQKLKSWRINIFERHLKLHANSWHS